MAREFRRPPRRHVTNPVALEVFAPWSPLFVDAKSAAITPPRDEWERLKFVDARMLPFLFKYGAVARTRRLPLFHLEFPLDFNEFAICATDSHRFRPHTILGAVSVFEFFIVKLYKFEMRCFCVRTKIEFEATSTPQQLFHRSNSDTCRPQMLSYWFSKHLVHN